MELYYQLNFLSIFMSLWSVITSIYIKISLKKSLIFNMTMYKKFIILCCTVFLIFTVIMFHFVIFFIQNAQFNLAKWVQCLSIMTKMTSDNIIINFFECLFTVILFIGTYTLIYLSDQVESEINSMEKLKNMESYKKTSDI
jgi:hypothetical protein